MVATSEIGVTVSIDNKDRLAAITEELKKLGTVTVDENMCIVCVVGDMAWTHAGFESIVADALKEVPLRMISYGASDHNISFLIRESDKRTALQALSDKLFNATKK